MEKDVIFTSFLKKLRYVKIVIAKIWMNSRTIIWVKGFENDFGIRWNMCVFRHLITLSY